MSELRFDGQAAIVTGAGRGLGRCHALELARRGARVVVADLGSAMDGTGSSHGPADEVVAEIRAAGGEAVASYGSVADPEQAGAMVTTAIDSFGRLDVVVNNAGITDPGPFVDITLDAFRRMVDVHFWGTTYVSRAAWPHLRAAPDGCIVNTTSEALFGILPKLTSYAAAKGAILGLTRGLAAEGVLDGVRVNAIAPRGDTRMATPQTMSIVLGISEESFVAMDMPPMPAELVSPVVAYLAHPSCRLNGEILAVGSGKVQRIVIQETAGIRHDDLAVEHVADEIGQVLAVEGLVAMGLDTGTDAV
jgi:NAD(P)-dependent dehydrogenase (short-subunit alcohol dehydrogenase family)